MGKIRKILETELVGGTQSTDVYPVTSTKAVYDTNNKVLDDYIQQLKKTSTFAGIATPTTNPGTPNGNVFYLASEAGVYTNFSSITINTDEIAILVWNNGATWKKEFSGFASSRYLMNEVARLDKKIDDKKSGIDAAKEEALQAIAENEQSAITNFNSQRVTPEMLSESTKQLIEASGGGTITNLADDEDITSVDDGTGSNVLKFADRTYNADNFSGKGYKILRKNIVSGVNTLTQSMINQTNTTYVIQYDFTLGEDITIPDNCILDFKGGSLNDGKLNPNECFVINSSDTVIFKNISFDFYGKSFSDKCVFKNIWFDAIPHTLPFENLEIVSDFTLVMSSVSYIRPNTYLNFKIKGNGHTMTVTESVTGSSYIQAKNIWVSDLNIICPEVQESMAIPIFNSWSFYANNLNFDGFTRLWANWSYSTEEQNTLYFNNCVCKTRSFLVEGNVTNVIVKNCDISVKENSSYGKKIFSIWPYTNLKGTMVFTNNHINGYYEIAINKAYEKVTFTNCTLTNGYVSSDAPISSIDLEGYQGKVEYYNCIYRIDRPAYGNASFQNIRYIKFNNCIIENSIDNTSSVIMIYPSATLEIVNCKIDTKGEQLVSVMYAKTIVDANLGKTNIFVNNCTFISNVQYGCVMGMKDATENYDYDTLFNIVSSQNKRLSTTELTYWYCDFIKGNINLKQVCFPISGGIVNETELNYLTNSPKYTNDEPFTVVVRPMYPNIAPKTIVTIIPGEGYIKNGVFFANGELKSPGILNYDNSSKRYRFWNSNYISGEWEDRNYSAWLDIGGIFTYDKIRGTTDERPKSIKNGGNLRYLQNLDVGYRYYDTNLEKWIYLKRFNSAGVETWAEYDGTKAGIKRSGTFAEKPAAADIYIGFTYFCTDKQTAEGASNGIIIYHKGNGTWVDALGRVVS